MTKQYQTEPTGPGFYKQQDDMLLYGTMITGSDYFLLNEEHDQYTYPVDGWSWFEDEIQAREALGLPPLEEIK